MVTCERSGREQTYFYIFVLTSLDGPNAVKKRCFPRKTNIKFKKLPILDLNMSSRTKRALPSSLFRRGRYESRAKGHENTLNQWLRLLSRFGPLVVVAVCRGNQEQRWAMATCWFSGSHAPPSIGPLLLEMAALLIHDNGHNGELW